MVDISDKRIQLGESNVKKHIFLSLISGETESIESGDNCELEIAGRAMDSLRYCHDLSDARPGSHRQIGHRVRSVEDLSNAFSEQEEDWMDFDVDMVLQDVLMYYEKYTSLISSTMKSTWIY